MGRTMKQLNLAEAKAKLSHLVDQAAKGRGVIIAKSGIPMAKLVPLDDEKPKEFVFGTLKGVLTDEVADAIGAPLPGEILDVMLNGPLDSGAGK
jgi:prevent-host-death family protein